MTQINNLKKNKENLLKFCFAKIKKAKLNKINTGLSSYLYFPSWYQCPGYEVLISHNNKNYFTKLYIYLKYFLYVFKLIKINIHPNLPINYNDYDTIVVSWASKKDFDNNGAYKDKHFNIKASNNKKILWFIIFDGALNFKINDENIKIIYLENKLFFFNFIEFFKIIHSLIKLSKLNLVCYLHYLSYYSFYAIAIKNIILKNEYKHLKRILMPYEGQPFQNFVFEQIKIKYNNIDSIGVNHSSLSPFPSNMIYRDGSPNKIIVNGNNQKKILINNLNWSDKNIFIKNSLRYCYDVDYNLTGNILFPHNLSNFNDYIKIFNNFIKNTKLQFGKLDVKIHPFYTDNKKNIFLKKNFEKIINKYKNKFDSNISDKRVIILGSTTSVVLALELNIEVIHICANEIIECFSNDLWKSIEIENIHQNVFRYKLKNKNDLINFRDNYISFNDYLQL